LPGYPQDVFGTSGHSLAALFGEEIGGRDIYCRFPTVRTILSFQQYYLYVFKGKVKILHRTRPLFSK
jgi:hypothetical protein